MKESGATTADTTLKGKVKWNQFLLMNYTNQLQEKFKKVRYIKLSRITFKGLIILICIY